MAHISKRKLQDGTVRYRAHVSRGGQTLTQGGFAGWKDAKRWAHEQERAILLTGLPLTNEQLKGHTVGDLVRRYLKEVTPTKGSHVSEAATLNKFLSYAICKKSLASVDNSDAYEYIALRQKETWRGKPIKNSTIRRDLNSISNVFVVARQRWKGLTTLPNPFHALDKNALRGSVNRRKRRLKEGELEALEQACKRCLGLNKTYVPLAIHLAVDTGMRLQEIFNLTWQDVDIDKRRIEIRKSKTDHKSAFKGRTIVFSFPAMVHLSSLRAKLLGAAERMGKAPNALKAELAKLLKPLMHEEARIFPMTTDAFKQAWFDVRKRAKIKDLTFHDLRHEAGSRFDEAGLTKAEHDLMMGHNNGDMASVYIHSDLKVIQDKLDRYLFNGMTLDEVQAENEKIKAIENAPNLVQFAQHTAS